MSDVYDKKPYVVTYKEIVIIFGVFAFILIMLYPKDMIEKDVLSEQSNYDLSILYLKNLLKNDPNNERLLIALAQKSFKINKKDFSYKMLELLKKSLNNRIRAQAYMLSYKIAKEDYIYLKKHRKKSQSEKKLKELKDLFEVIIKNGYYSKLKLTNLLDEAIFLNDYKVELKLVKKLLKIRPKSIKLLNQAFYASYKIKKYNQSLYFVEKLINLDKKHRKKWEEQKFFILLHKISYKNTERRLRYLARKSKFWRLKLIEFYKYNKKFIKAANIYLKLFYKVHNKKNKRKLFVSIIDTYLAGELGYKAVNFAHKYEDLFFDDKKIRVKLLKLYLSQNRIDYAHKLAEKILYMKDK